MLGDVKQSELEQTKFLLDESELPRRWYNIRADMPNPPQPVLTRVPASRSGLTTSLRSFQWS